MDNKELERIQKELLAEEEVELPGAEDISLDELLQDKELNDLLFEDTDIVFEEAEPAFDDPEPAFDDPEKIHDPKKPMEYQNYANDYGAPKKDAAAEIREKDDRSVVILMIVASVLCLGIIGILGYWMSFLL